MVIEAITVLLKYQYFAKEVKHLCVWEYSPNQLIWIISGLYRSFWNINFAVYKRCQAVEEIKT